MFSRKYRIHAILLLSVLVIIFVPQFTNKPDKQKSAAATTAATEFLQLVDSDRYAESWQIAAQYLQQKVPRTDWTAKLTNIRTTFGPFMQRELENISFTAPAEELPDQEFILLEYATKFELKEVNEILTVMHDTDGSWRVVGYFIQ